MAFCKNCGSQLPEGARNCPSCGADTSILGGLNNFNNTTDSTAYFDPQDISNNKVMAVLAYLSWLVIIPLIAAPQSRFARFHANQGLVLAIVSTIWGMVSGVLGVIPFIGWIISVVMGLGSIFFLVLMIIGIVNAANGVAKELPLIGKITIIK